MSETPAETLRRAARLMRERAEAATQGSWLYGMAKWNGEPFAAVLADTTDVSDPATWIMATGRRSPDSVNPDADAAHAASWHPGVALAVADWLDREAALIDAQVFPQSDPAMERCPLAVAHAYLRERRRDQQRQRKS